MVSSISRTAALVALVLPAVLGAPVTEIASNRIQLRTKYGNDICHGSGPIDAVWEMFQSERNTMLRQLAVPVEDCWSRPAPFLPGYTSPMFHACVDWHSSVHAAYSLYAITTATKDGRYRRVADSVVRNDLVQTEIDYMNTANYKNKTFVEWETPYGMAWMIDLVMQRKKTTGDDGLRPLAVYAAGKLKSFLESLSAEDLRKETMKPAHDNLTWGMIHLARWAKYIQDRRLLKLIQAKILPVLMDPALDKSCPVSADTTSEFAEFFPTCLLRVAGVIQLWNGSNHELKSWVNARVQATFTVPAVTKITDVTAHQNAINFSRAYTLWYIYLATGNAVFRSNYATLITYQVSRRDLWDIQAGYNASHFVAQFGVRAIEASRDTQLL